jgi:hypothetical protein
MGTQQILLIVLSVIIVGAAIAVGITMFNNQSYSSNKTAIAADAQNFASQVVQYYKTPASQGGGDRKIPTGTDAAKTIANFIGWGDTATYKNDNGWYTLAVTSSGASGEVTITGVGREKNGDKVPKIETKIEFPEGKITATASDDGIQGS